MIYPNTLLKHPRTKYSSFEQGGLFGGTLCNEGGLIWSVLTQGIMSVRDVGVI